MVRERGKRVQTNELRGAWTLYPRTKGERTRYYAAARTVLQEIFRSALRSHHDDPQYPLRLHRRQSGRDDRSGDQLWDSHCVLGDRNAVRTDRGLEPASGHHGGLGPRRDIFPRWALPDGADEN